MLDGYQNHTKEGQTVKQKEDDHLLDVYRTQGVLKGIKCQSVVSVQPKKNTHSYPSEMKQIKKKSIYLTKSTVSFQKDSSQLGPGTPSAHRGNK